MTPVYIAGKPKPKTKRYMWMKLKTPK